MIAIDTNILVYAFMVKCPLHQQASACLSDLFNSGTPCAIPWPCVHEFYNIVTHPKIYADAADHDAASMAIRTWIELPQLHFLSEGQGYWPVLAQIIHESEVVGPKVHDARIAALCISHGVRELWSLDRDFSRFPRLKLVNPLTK